MDLSVDPPLEAMYVSAETLRLAPPGKYFCRLGKAEGIPVCEWWLTIKAKNPANSSAAKKQECHRQINELFEHGFHEMEFWRAVG